jgi:hypothetical protein
VRAIVNAKYPYVRVLRFHFVVLRVNLYSILSVGGGNGKQTSHCA